MLERIMCLFRVLGIPALIILICSAFVRQADAVIIFSASDPAGDTFGSGTPAHDIESLTVDLAADGDTLTIVVQFYGTIAAPSDFASDSIEGYIDIDIDNDASTGDPVSPPFYANHLDEFGTGAPAPGLGVEYYLDIGSEFFQPGQVDIVSTASLLPVGTAQITFTTNSFTASFLLSDIGAAISDSDPDINVGAVFGPFGGGSGTDQTPNNDAVPEPGTLSLVAFGLSAAFGLARFRRIGRKRAAA